MTRLDRLVAWLETRNARNIRRYNVRHPRPRAGAVTTIQPKGKP